MLMLFPDGSLAVSKFDWTTIQEQVLRVGCIYCTTSLLLRLSIRNWPFLSALLVTAESECTVRGGNENLSASFCFSLLNLIGSVVLESQL